ncbi:MAG: hypothetical protein ACI8RD_004338 [Bacillariaceae sp.]|jgi:hypothetical protein
MQPIPDFASWIFYGADYFRTLKNKIGQTFYYSAAIIMLLFKKAKNYTVSRK